MLKYHIQTIEVGSGGATDITFNNIPADYTDLYLVTSLRVASGTSYYWDVDLNINGESAREWRGFYALGTSVSTNSSTAFNIVGGANGNGTTANTFSNIDTLITNYASTDVKALSSEGVAENDSSSQYFLTINANRITNSAPINSLTLAVASNSFAEHSSASLYGIKHGVDGDVEAAADGGAITQSGGYTIHTFTSSGTFVANRDMDVEYVVVGGGGGGGTLRGGGGGAGGYRSSVSGESSGGGDSAEAKIRVSSGESYVVAVGGGGAGSTSQSITGVSGSSSTFSTITSIGGGGGDSNNVLAALNGGSGGGAVNTGTAGTGITGQGFDGGVGSGAGSTQASGGGGGAGAVGANASSGNGGAGGAGVTSSITGSAVARAGGGGGGAQDGTGGAGGSGVGGAGTDDATTAGAGTVNTGSGGGGGGWTGSSAGTGGAGGSGIVIIRYPTPA